MTYGSATITGSATPAADLRTVIEGLMTSQGNWELVDTYTASTWSVRIWRCKATNSLGTQWYLGLLVNSSSPLNLELRPFEDFVTATRLGIRGIANTSALDVPTGSPYGNTGYAPENGNWAAFTYMQTSTSSFTYRVRVTSNGIMAVTSTGAYPLYTGLFNKLWTHANEFPLMRQWFGYNSSVPGFTRRPGATSGSSGIWYVTTTYPAFDNTYGSLATPDALCGSDVYASRLQARMDQSISGSLELVRGHLDTDFMGFFKNDNAVALGDTITIAGNPYVCIYDGGVSASYWMRTD